MRRGIFTLFVWVILKAAEGDPGYTMDVYQESPGVYFENLGHVTLSHTTWTIIVYVPLNAIDDEMSNLEQYAQYIDQTCARMIIRNWTACRHFGDIMAHKLRRIGTTRRLPPRMMSPVLLLETLKNSVSSFPTDAILPFPLGRDYLFSLHQLSDVRVYTYRKRLGYVISLPFVNKRTFTTWWMSSIPVPVDQDHFLYIDVRDSVVIRPDQTVLFYYAGRRVR